MDKLLLLSFLAGTAGGLFAAWLDQMSRWRRPGDDKVTSGRQGCDGRTVGASGTSYAL
jgi:nitrate/nitrite transporter NarK